MKLKSQAQSDPEEEGCPRQGGASGRRRNNRLREAIQVKDRRPDFIEDSMIAGARALGLTIDPAWRENVKFHLRLVLDHAARVDAFDLPDDTEPAPVFHA
jgi:hypothetical protein